MEYLRNDDIFNPENARRKAFITKKRIKMFFLLFIVICFIGYGAKEYLVKNTVVIEIRTMKYKKIKEVSFLLDSNETLSTGYVITNKSPYPIILDISLIGNGTLTYETNYNGIILNRGSYINIAFLISNASPKQSTCIVKFGGIKA